MVDCRFILQDNKYVCEICGYETQIVGLHRNCLVSTPRKVEERNGGEEIGTILQEMIKFWFGIVPEPEACDCDDIVRLMNRMGPVWCQNNEEWILGKMAANAEKMKIVFNKSVARLMLRRAVKKSKRCGGV